MTKKRTAPTTQKETAGARSSVQYKGRVISLSNLQFLAFILLSDGKQHSSNEINRVCRTSCARDLVIALIRKGINVQKNVAESTPDIPWHKLYFIDPKECCNE